MLQIRIYSKNFRGRGPEECRTCPHLDMYESDCGIMSRMTIPGWQDGKEGFPINFFDRCPFVSESAKSGQRSDLMSIEELRTVLFGFVQRASSEKATPDEVRALPDVVKVLLEAFR